MFPWFCRTWYSLILVAAVHRCILNIIDILVAGSGGRRAAALWMCVKLHGSGCGCVVHVHPRAPRARRTRTDATRTRSHSHYSRHSPLTRHATRAVVYST